MERLKIAVLASGSGSNLQAIIDEIKSGFLPVELALVLSDKPQAYALQRAEAAGVPTKVLLPADFASREDYDAELVRLLKASGAEAVALAGYMRLVTPVFLQAFPHRVLNIHPALLPSFPGTDSVRLLNMALRWQVARCILWMRVWIAVRLFCKRRCRF